MSINNPENRRRINLLAVPFLVVGLISLVTACGFTFDGGEDQIFQLPFSGGEVGPIHVEERKAVRNVIIKSDYIDSNSWLYVEAEVLDQNKNFLFSFHKELWAETGYDSDGRWSEKDKDLQYKVTFQEPGSYFIMLNTERSTSLHEGVLYIKISSPLGSSLPNLVFGGALIVIAILMWVYANVTSSHLEALFSSDD